MIAAPRMPIAGRRRPKRGAAGMRNRQEETERAAYGRLAGHRTTGSFCTELMKEHAG
jgi:hypothetical protein